MPGFGRAECGLTVRPDFPHAALPDSFFYKSAAIRDGGPVMDEGKRKVLVLTGLYIVFLCGAWLWFHPYFVSQRVHGQIAIGASAQEVEKAFQVRTYDFPGSAYCGADGPPIVTRIAIDESARIPILPIPMVMVTTTVFCFDRNDKLAGMKSERWFDEL